MCGVYAKAGEAGIALRFRASEAIIIDTGTTLAGGVGGRIEVCATDGRTVATGQGSAVHALLFWWGVPPTPLADSSSQYTSTVAPDAADRRATAGCEVLAAFARPEGKEAEHDGKRYEYVARFHNLLYEKFSINYYYFTFTTASLLGGCNNKIMEDIQGSK